MISLRYMINNSNKLNRKSKCPNSIRPIISRPPPKWNPTTSSKTNSNSKPKICSVNAHSSIKSTSPIPSPPKTPSFNKADYKTKTTNPPTSTPLPPPKNKKATKKNLLKLKYKKSSKSARTKISRNTSPASSARSSKPKSRSSTS